MHAELTLGHGIAVGREAVARLMRRAGLQGISGRPRYRKVPNVATAADRVQRQLQHDGRDQLERRDADDLVSAQTGATRVGASIAEQVLANQLSDLRTLVQNPARHLQLSGMLMRAPRGHQRKLRFSELAHCFTPQFGDSRVRSVTWQKPTYTNRNANWDSDCANSLSTQLLPNFKTGTS